jgi:hypothetical protein
MKQIKNLDNPLLICVYCKEPIQVGDYYIEIKEDGMCEIFRDKGFTHIHCENKEVMKDFLSLVGVFLLSIIISILLY